MLKDRFLDTPPSKECEVCLWKKENEEKKKKKATRPETKHTGVAQERNILFKTC